MHDSCTWGACQGFSPTKPKDAVTTYDSYSYDYAEPYSQEIVLTKDSCPANSKNRYCSPEKANTIQLVKMLPKDAVVPVVGLLEVNSKDVDSVLNSKGNSVPAFTQWDPVKDKKTYRFCVETQQKYLVNKETADSLLKDSKENVVLSLAPIRYKFAVSVAQLNAVIPGPLLGQLTVELIPQQTATVGIGYSYTVAASGGSGTYTYSLISFDGTWPTGININPITGVISGTPAPETKDSFYLLGAIVTDGTSTAGANFGMVIN